MKTPCWIIMQLVSAYVMIFLLLRVKYNEFPLTKSDVGYRRQLNSYNQTTNSRLKEIGSNRYTFSCGNIQDIEIIQKNVGGGRSKCVDIGVYRGQKVVIKRLARYKHPRIDEHYRQLIFLKEILLSQQLSHRNLIQLLGYCVRSLKTESYKKFPQFPDISAVYEFGEEFNITQLYLSIDERFKHAKELTSLLVYFHDSPLGSLLIGDFNPHHFLMVNNSIKLIDLDYVHNIECPCNIEKQNCGHNIKCVRRLNLDLATESNCTEVKDCPRGVCKGLNDRFNIGFIHKYFLQFLLNPDNFNGEMKTHIINLQSKITKHKINSKELESMVSNASNYNKNMDDK